MEKFQIELDRASGIYYAGEVVSGTLTVTPDNNEKCRALQVSMVGKSKVHWHTGSGDSRRDYYGSKTFLWHQRTLWGNFYRTALLDSAGENAQFGGAVGDGDIYIPCLPSEGSNGGPMKLIVRVCDYDWGKRDDNLGEIVVDVKNLTLREDEMTFDLMRNGKPEKGNITLTARFIPTQSITPPDTKGGKRVVSKIESTETLVLKVLRANELRKADWGGKNDVYVQVWRAPESLPYPPPLRKKLPGPDMKVTLPNGSTEFKFSFPTRADSPGSAVLRCGDYAYVAYYIFAKIDKKLWKDPSMKKPVVILPNRPVPMPILLAPAFSEIGPLPMFKGKCCCLTFGRAGDMKIKMCLARRAYAPGETIDFTGSQVENNSSIPVTLCVTLRQRIKLSQTGTGHFSHLGFEKIELGNLEVESLSSSSLENIKITIPAVPPSFFGAKGLSSARREALTFGYVLSLAGKSSGGYKVRVDMPILISALPPTTDATEQAMSSSPIQVQNTKDPFGLETHAVIDDKPANTVIMATGLEDCNGAVTPASTGAGNLWHQDEDSGGSANSYLYSPQVVVFGGDAQQQQQQQQQDSVYEYTVPEVVDNIDNSTAYNVLISSMETEYDSRLAADKWIKQYPSAASSLSADEFAGVLKKTVFSMEQGAVARELVSGLGSGVLNTNFIVAAMKACQFSKPILVSVMAPHVSDPENKEVVLAELYPYERRDLENAFTH